MVKKHLLRKGVAYLLSAAMVLTGTGGIPGGVNTASAEEASMQLTDDDIKNLYQNKSNNRVTVHDPSIIKAGEQYYIHGTQQGAATTTDLVDWTTLDFSKNETKTMYAEDLETIFANNTSGYNADAYFRAYGQAAGAKWEVPGNLWAPDIIYNPDMNKYCMYLSLNGRVWNSVIVLLTSDSVDGPFEYAGPVIFSGFTDGNVATTGDTSTENTNAEAAKYTNTDLKKVLDACGPDIDNKDSDKDGLPDRYDDKIINVKGVDDGANKYGTYLPHAIDPCVFYDESGTLWMTYGSWSGGIYILKLDGKTGLRDYSESYGLTYSNTSNAGTITSDPYFGKKIAGGFYVSGEGSYIEKIGDYYYLFMSYGFYDPAGGYEMRIFRSENPDGPYVDSNEVNAIYDKYELNYGPNAVTNRGEKLMGNYQWDTMDIAEVAQGHNSAFVDDDGRAYVIYHTKFNDGTYGHTVRVHELFLNEDGWLVAAPYEFSGEITLGATASCVKGSNNQYTITTSDYNTTSWQDTDVAGDYQLLVHKYKVNHTNYEVVEPVDITLNTNGTITGAMTGSWAWSSKGQPYITVTVGGTAYKGVFTNQIIDGSTAEILCFTAMDTKTGVNIWGTKKLTDNVAVAKNAVRFSAIIPENTYTDIELSDKTTDDVAVKWLSSDENIISTTGKVTAPSVDTTITLTARLSKGNYYYDKIYTTTVKAGGINNADIETGLVANYDFEGDGFLNKVNNSQHGTAMALSAGTKPSIEYNNEQGSKILHQYFGFPDGNSTSYVQFPNPLKGESIDGATVSLWVNRIDSDVWDAIWSFFDEETGRVYLTPNAYLGFNAGGQCWFDCNHPGSVITNKIAINDWNLVTVSMDSNGFGIYINGELVFTESKNEAFVNGSEFTGYQLVIDLIKSSADFYLGYGSWWGSSPLLMDNLKIYGRALAEVDVAKLYAAERAEVKDNLEAGGNSDYVYYEDYSKITTSTIKDVWSSGSAQNSITLTENDEVYGNYMTFTQLASDSGNRSAISSFGTEVQGLDNYTIETDISIRSGNVNNRSQSQFVITGTDTDVNAGSNGISSKGYILSLATNIYNGSNGTEWYLNGDTKNPITIPADQWVHIKATVDKNKKVVMVDILKDGKSLYSGTVCINGTGTLSGLYVLSGRGNGLTKIDNTTVKTSLADGIIAEYLFDNNLNDSVNDGKEAEVIATYDAAKSEIAEDSSRGNVMEMRGEWQATGYLSLGTDYLDSITDAFSVSMWAKANNSKTAGLDPDVKNCGGSTGLFNFKTKEGNSPGFCALDVSLHPWINDYNGNFLDRSNEQLALSSTEWIQVTMTMDFANQNICVYIDGKLSEKINALGGGSFAGLLESIKKSYDIQIGTLLPWWDTWDFRGYVDDIRLYNKALTEADAKELYQLSSDKTVLAENNYTIAFDANGGTGTMQEMDCSMDSKYTLTENTFVNPGYAFMGWSTTRDGEVEYFDKNEVVNLTNIIGDTITLYAVWKLELELTDTTITGDVVYGNSLTASASNNLGITDYNYQWYRSNEIITDDTDISKLELISGAVKDNYVIQKEDIGKYLAVNIVVVNETYGGSCKTYTTEVVQPKIITAAVSVKDKEYDGSTNAEVSGITLDGIIESDEITAVAESAIFIDAKAGDNKEVTVSNIVLGGENASCYKLEQDTIKTTANINKSSITPNMPEASINVPNTKKKVGDVTLPTDWTWLAEDAEKEIPEDSGIKATAIYNGADKGNYITESIEIIIQKVDCVHEEKETRNEKQATCTEAGYSGDIYCTFCGLLISEGNTVEALGHDYEVVIIKPATATENGIQEKTCKRCDDSYTEEIPKTGTATPAPSPTGSGSGSSSGGGSYIPGPVTPNQPGGGTGPSVPSSNPDPGTSQAPTPSVMPSASPIPSSTPSASQEPAPGTDIKVDEETGAVTETTTSTDGNKIIVTEKVIMPDGSESVKETVTEDTGDLVNVTETLTDSSTNSVLVTEVTSDSDGNVIDASAVVYTGGSDTDSQYSVKTVIPKDYFENVKDAGLDSVDIYVEKPTVDNVKEKSGPKMLIKIAVPDVDGVSVRRVMVTKDSIESAKGSSKKLVVKIQNENPSKSYTVTIPQDQLKKMDQEINVSVKTDKVSGMGSSNRNKVNKILSSNKVGKDNSYTVAIASNNTKGGIKVTTPAMLPSAKKGDKVYAYAYNKKTGKLEEIPNSQRSVIKNGEVAIEGFSGDTYVITDKELSGKKVVKLLDKTKVSVGKASVKKGGKTKVKLDLGTGLVAKPSVKSSTPYAKQAAVVTYKSSDPKKAKVSKNGTITAKGKGKQRLL